VLIDFGAARQSMGEKNKSMSVIMKAGFSPEEQYRSKGVQGPWTDIYAVAATLYYSITGNKPPESLDRLADDLLVTPLDLGIEMSKNTEQAMMKALAVKAEERYQTVEEFQADLMKEPAVTVVETQSEVSQADRGDIEPANESVQEDSVKVEMQSDAINSEPSEKTFHTNYTLLGVVVVVLFIALGSYYLKNNTTAIPAGTEATVAEEEQEVETGPEADIIRVATIRWDEGLYTGELIADVPNGKGNWTGADGSLYDGYWYEGQYFGDGIFQHPDGTTEEGLWANGQLPSNYIEEIGAEIIGMKIFEGSDDPGEHGTFEYNDSFNFRTARYMWWELDIELDSENYDRTIFFTEYYYRISSGRVYDLFYVSDVNLTIEADTTGGWFWTGSGWSEPGNWYQGTYMVVIANYDQVFAINTFTLY